MEEHGHAFANADVNLDGSVDVADFNVWNNNKFQSDRGWCDGDFNLDSVVDTSDFNIWNGRKFTTGPVAVPHQDFVFTARAMHSDTEEDTNRHPYLSFTFMQ